MKEKTKHKLSWIFVLILCVAMLSACAVEEGNDEDPDGDPNADTSSKDQDSDDDSDQQDIVYPIQTCDVSPPPQVGMTRNYNLVHDIIGTALVSTTTVEITSTYVVQNQMFFWVELDPDLRAYYGGLTGEEGVPISNNLIKNYYSVENDQCYLLKEEWSSYDFYGVGDLLLESSGYEFTNEFTPQIRYSLFSPNEPIVKEYTKTTTEGWETTPVFIKDTVEPLGKEEINISSGTYSVNKIKLVSEETNEETFEETTSESTVWFDPQRGIIRREGETWVQELTSFYPNLKEVAGVYSGTFEEICSSDVEFDLKPDGSFEARFIVVNCPNGSTPSGKKISGRYTLDAGKIRGWGTTSIGLAHFDLTIDGDYLLGDLCETMVENRTCVPNGDGGGFYNYSVNVNRNKSITQLDPANNAAIGTWNGELVRVSDEATLIISSWSFNTDGTWHMLTGLMVLNFAAKLEYKGTYSVVGNSIDGTGIFRDPRNDWDETKNTVINLTISNTGDEITGTLTDNKNNQTYSILIHKD